MYGKHAKQVYLINKSTIKLRTVEHNMLSTSNYFEAAVTKENTTPPSVLRIRKQQFNLQTLTKFGQGTQTKQNCNSSNGVERHFHVGGLKCKCLCKHTTCRRWHFWFWAKHVIYRGFTYRPYQIRHTCYAWKQNRFVIKPVITICTCQATNSPGTYIDNTSTMHSIVYIKLTFCLLQSLCKLFSYICTWKERRL